MTESLTSRYPLVPGTRLAILVKDRSFQIIGNRDGLLALASELSDWWQHGRNLFFKEDGYDSIEIDEMWEVDSCKRNTFLEVDTSAFEEPLKWWCVLDKERSEDFFMVGFAKGDPNTLFEVILDSEPLVSPFRSLLLLLNTTGFLWLQGALSDIASGNQPRKDFVSCRWSLSVTYSDSFPATEAELITHVFVDFPINITMEESEERWNPERVTIYSSDELDELVCKGDWYKTIAEFLLSSSRRHQEGVVILDFDEGDIRWSSEIPNWDGKERDDKPGPLRRLIIRSDWNSWDRPEVIETTTVYQFSKTVWVTDYPTRTGSTVSYERRASEGIIELNKEAFITLCEWFAYTAFISSQIPQGEKRFAHYHLSYLKEDWGEDNMLPFDLIFNLS